MKYIIERTSGDWVRTEEGRQRRNPCPKLNPKLEDVIDYNETLKKKWVLEVDDIVEFVKKVGDNVIVRIDSDYELPVLEIYDDYRE